MYDEEHGHRTAAGGLRGAPSAAGTHPDGPASVASLTEQEEGGEGEGGPRGDEQAPVSPATPGLGQQERGLGVFEMQHACFSPLWSETAGHFGWEDDLMPSELM
jgi:hypothetical protein